jgi:hypothetical protein
MRKQPRARQPAPSLQAGGTLVNVCCVVVELADEALAKRDINSAQALIELAMSVFHTAATIEPDMGSNLAETRTRLRAVTASVSEALPLNRQADPENRWPYQVV